MTTSLQPIVDRIVSDMAAETERGQVATYIPGLANVSPDQFGMAIVTADGDLITGGDASVPFSTQSVSKVFALTLALGKVGDHLWRRVGREPSGNAFNSIVQLEAEK